MKYSAYKGLAGGWGGSRTMKEEKGMFPSFPGLTSVTGPIV